MHALRCTQPINARNFSSRAETLGAVVLPFDVNKVTGEGIFKNKFVLIGIPDDRGVQNNAGSAGASEGPKEFRNAFYKLYNSSLRAFGGTVADVFVDLGDVVLADNIEQTHESLATLVEFSLRQSAEMVFVIGGGHDFSFGSYLGQSRASTESEIIPILNLDAHFDLRELSADGSINSGTPFRRIIEKCSKSIADGAALLELGIQRERNGMSLYDFAEQKKVAVVEYNEILKVWKCVTSGKDAAPLDHVFDHLERCSTLGWKRASDKLHLSIDLDVYSQSIAPGTSAATPMGASFSSLAPVLSFCAKNRSTRVVDVAELCPVRDVNNITSRLAAGIVYNMICLRAETVLSTSCP